jgi:tetratricopeptide (TPR) repeat protein
VHPYPKRGAIAGIDIEIVEWYHYLRLKIGRVMPATIRLSILFIFFLSACAAPTPVREANYPIDCRKDQPIKELLKRGDTHRNFMMKESPAENTTPEQWVKIRGIHGARARTCYQLVLDVRKDHHYALLNMGFTHLVESTFPDLKPEAREKSLVTATNYVQQALDVRRLDAQAYYYLGEIAARRGQCDKAIRILNSLVSSRWSYSHVYAWMGYCYETKEKPNEAKDAYKKAVELSNPVDIAEWAKKQIKK